MAKRILIVALAALLLPLTGAQPTSAPATPQPWLVIVRKLPRDMRPPGDKDWTHVELREAAKWVAEQMKDSLILVETEKFVYSGGEKNKARFESKQLTVYGVRWRLSGNIELNDASDKRCSQNRKREQWRVSGIAKTPGAVSGERGNALPVAFISITMSNADAR